MNLFSSSLSGITLIFGMNCLTLYASSFHCPLAEQVLLRYSHSEQDWMAPHKKLLPGMPVFFVKAEYIAIPASVISRLLPEDFQHHESISFKPRFSAAGYVRKKEWISYDCIYTDPEFAGVVLILNFGIIPVLDEGSPVLPLLSSGRYWKVNKALHLHKCEESIEACGFDVPSLIIRYTGETDDVVGITGLYMSQCSESDLQIKPDNLYLSDSKPVYASEHSRLILTSGNVTVDISAQRQAYGFLVGEQLCKINSAAVTSCSCEAANLQKIINGPDTALIDISGWRPRAELKVAEQTGFSLSCVIYNIPLASLSRKTACLNQPDSL